MKKIKNNHILVVGAGASLANYWGEIKDFIAENDLVTVGCNRVNHILTPDYHFWLDKKVYEHFGSEVDKKSVIVFGDHFDKKLMDKHCRGESKIIKYTKMKWKDSYDDPNHKYYRDGDIKYSKKKKEFHGVFRTAGSLAILWAYIKKASKISVVGMDGYTLYSKEELSGRTKEKRQHCYGKGFTDSYARNMSPKSLERDKKEDEFHKRCVKKDADIYRTLRAIRDYGVEFEIITPTVYKEFYNSDILNTGRGK